jgi:signal transduction histidine kinase
MVAEYVDTKHSILNELMTIESTFKPSITEAIWDMDDEQLEKLANGISKLPTVTKIDIYDANDEVILSSTNNYEKDDSSFYHEFKTIHKSEQKEQVLGKVRLYSNTKNVLDRVELGFVIIIVNAIIKTTALCLLFLWAFRKYLIIPLRELTNEVNSIDLKNISGKRIKISNEDENELSVLEGAFNNLLVNVDKSKKELDIVNKELEDKVKERTKKLTYALYEVKTQKDELQKTIEDLNKTQNQLIESEKMAALGQLIAGVAHEINTPLGAIKSSGSNINESLKSLLSELPNIFKILKKEEEDIFFEMIEFASSSKELLTTREERKLRKEIEKKLDNMGIEDTRTLSSHLVKMKIYDDLESFKPLFTHAEATQILGIALKVSDLMNNTSNINIAVERAGKIVFALKSFSRFNNSEEKIKANLKDSVETVLTIYNNQIKQNTELVREYEDVDDIDCFPDELAQVWTNLIHNALQAMNYKGKLTIAIKDTPTHQTVSIKDSGSGIPKDIIDKIFDPFFTTKPAGEGSGLGLDIIRKIINKHSGTISVNSEIDVGTEFVVSIPK